MSDQGKSPIHNQHGRSPLARDSQQWLLDYLIQETGKPQHFQGGRGWYPKSIQTHAMISKHLGQEAERLEGFADRERERQHAETALVFYYHAALMYAQAQHPIFELNDEKRFLYAGVRRCYDWVIALAPYRLEHVDVAWNGSLVSGNLHLNPNTSEPAPLLFYIAGCDAVKEAYPHPLFNYAHQRGMHMFSFDGPGQAECTMREIWLTADNYESAASAALDYLVQRPEIDANKVVVYANSFGSFWGMRFAASDSRIKAVAAPQVSICEKYIHTDLESPRWKQLFAFLTQAGSEAALDQIMGEMTMEGYMDRIQCPVLMTVGEFDPRAPLEEMYRLYDQLTVPSQLWVMVDQHHFLEIGDHGGPEWATAKDGIMADWLRDRIDGKPLEPSDGVAFVRGAEGSYGRSAQLRRKWFE